MRTTQQSHPDHGTQRCVPHRHRCQERVHGQYQTATRVCPEVIMATWKISNYHKKNAVERQIWQRDGKTIVREEGFRWGTWTCKSDTQPNLDLNNPEGYEVFSTEHDWELDEMVDGCWAEITAEDGATQKDLEEFEAAWEEDWFDGVEALGWVNDETEYWIYGPIELTNTDTDESWCGTDV